MPDIRWAEIPSPWSISMAPAFCFLNLVSLYTELQVNRARQSSACQTLVVFILSMSLSLGKSCRFP